MAFESNVVPGDWIFDMIVTLCKGKGKRNECKNYRGISLLSVVRKIYAEIFVDRVRRVTGGLTDDEQGVFRAGRGCVDQIFTLKQIGEKAREKKCRVYVDFIDLKKAYDRVNREALWHVLRMYDMGSKLLSLCQSKRGENEWFKIDRGLDRGVSYPLGFSICIWMQ